MPTSLMVLQGAADVGPRELCPAVEHAYPPPQAEGSGGGQRPGRPSSCRRQDQARFSINDRTYPNTSFSHGRRKEEYHYLPCGAIKGVTFVQVTAENVTINRKKKTETT